MTTIFAHKALTEAGWHDNLRIHCAGGVIEDMTPGRAENGDLSAQVLVPGMANLHSHAFQRGMAGLAERRGPAEDTFWTWRDLMYRFALTLTPEEAEAIAAQLYMEMLEAGFTRVGEFHYLHHAADGRPYDDPAEMAKRHLAASDRTGIAMTLLPVFYAHSDFGAAAPTDGQRRFIHDLDGFARLVEALEGPVAALPNGILGVAPHSLRAATPEEVARVAEMLPDGPVHIHAAEQVKEVADCEAALGVRPVRWLLDSAGADERWSVIHATHMDAVETEALARSGAVAGLCPLTEGNLGDGIFPAADFAAAGGRFGIGSDSNIRIGPAAELQHMEYAQRLVHRARNVLAKGEGSTGRAIFNAARRGGAQALGTVTGIAVGRPADMVGLRPVSADLPAGDGALDAWIFSDGAAVNLTVVQGVALVTGGRHRSRGEIQPAFQDAMRGLTTRV